MTADWKERLRESTRKFTKAESAVGRLACVGGSRYMGKTTYLLLLLRRLLDVSSGGLEGYPAFAGVTFFTRSHREHEIYDALACVDELAKGHAKISDANMASTVKRLEHRAREWRGN